MSENNETADSVETLRAVIADLEEENAAQAERIEALLAGDTLVRVRFVPVAKPTEKGPRYRYQIFLTGGLTGTIVSGPIFVKDGSVPEPRVAAIYGDEAIQTAQIVETFNNHVFSRPDSDGAVVMSNWTPTLRVAFMSYKATGKADQVVNFRQ